MPSLYSNLQARKLDSVLASIVVETSIRYSLTEGGRRMPFNELEIQSLRETQALALARLLIDRVMQL